MVYAVFLNNGSLYDVVLTLAEAQQTAGRLVGSFIEEYARIEDVPRHHPPKN